MAQMMSNEWLFLARQVYKLPDGATDSSTSRGIRWQSGSCSIQVHALDNCTMLGTFIERRSASRSNEIRRYGASRSDLERFIEDVRSFFVGNDCRALHGGHGQ